MNTRMKPTDTVVARMRRLIGQGDARGRQLQSAPETAQLIAARLGSMTIEPFDARPATQEQEVAARFFHATETGFYEDLPALLAENAIYLVPGKSGSSGLHRGRDAVIEALTTPVSRGVTIDSCEVTELLHGAGRAAGMVLLTGNEHDGQRFQLEIVLHLRCENGQIVAITEYSGDQYLADRLISG